MKQDIRLDLIGGSYPNRYPEINPRRIINLFPIVSSEQEKNKNKIALATRPGLDLLISNTGRHGRGIFTARYLNSTRTFCVIDTTLYEVGTNNVLTSRGTLPISVGDSPCWIEVNGAGQIMIANYEGSAIFTLSTNTLTTINDADFPGSIDHLTYVDGYFVVCSGGRTYFSNLNSGTAWTGADVFTPTFRADGVLALGSYNGRIINFGSETIEIYLNDGSTPWIRENKIISTGAVNAKSVASFDYGFVFLGNSRNGGINVFMLAEDYSVSPLADESIVWQLNKVHQSLEDASAYIIRTKDGRLVYRLSVPALKTTFCYDFSSKMWTEEQSIAPYTDSDGQIVTGPFRGKYHTNVNGKNLYQDIYTGNILVENYNSFTDVSETMLRQGTFGVYDQDGNLISACELELDTAYGIGVLSGQGSQPRAMLEVSTTGGRTYGQPRMIELSPLGQYDYKHHVTNLGSGKRWAVRISVTDPIDFMIQGAYANIQVGM